MSQKRQHEDDIERLNSGVHALHDELKNLALTCSPEFPREAVDALDLLESVAELQETLAAYMREILVRLFQSAGDKAAFSLDNRQFIDLWNDRAIAGSQNRSENEIDANIRKITRSLTHGTHTMGEEELRFAVKDEDISELLYWLSTLQQSLAWYAGRYIARLTGQLPGG